MKLKLRIGPLANVILLFIVRGYQTIDLKIDVHGKPLYNRKRQTSNRILTSTVIGVRI